MRRTITLAAAIAALLTGCSSSNDPASTAAPTSSSSPTADPAADDVDIAAELTVGQPWAAAVTSATQTEPGRVQVETSIVDPRGDDGSPEALQAIAICEGTVAWLQAQGAAEPHVSVMEADGTTFAIYSQTAVADLVPAQLCSEY